MKELLPILRKVPQFHNLVRALDAGKSPAELSGLAPVHRAHIAAGLLTELQRPVVLITADGNDAKRFAADVTAFTGITAIDIPAREFNFRENVIASREWEHSRISAFHTMAQGKAQLISISVDALVQRTMPPEELQAHSFEVRHDGTYDPAALADRLTAMGYSRCDQVEGVGQFALRGGILDVFPPAMDQPVRIEFWDQDVDSMGIFDVVTQRRVTKLEKAVFLPAAEALPRQTKDGWEATPDRLIPQRYSTLATAIDHFPPDAVVCIYDSAKVTEAIKSTLWRINEDIKMLLENKVISGGKHAIFAADLGQIGAKLMDFPVVYLNSFTTSASLLAPKFLETVQARQLSTFGTNLETALSDLAQYQKSNTGVVILVGSEQKALNLQKMLRERGVRTAVDFQLHELPQPGDIMIAVGGLSSGFDYFNVPWAVLSEGSGEPRHKTAKRMKDTENRRRIDSYTDLNPGDLVVHEKNGIGRFVGIVQMTVDGAKKDYIKIAYAGSDVLYIPASQLDSISKFIGAGEENQNRKLSSLGGKDWEKAKTRTRKAVKDLAKGLIKLYAERQKQTGFAFSPDSSWQQEFEADFMYTETEDQLRSIAEIKRDMESPRPMDRLLCGDVGFGKTEVALRAVMKCVMDGKQAAILVPTTVLARQHYVTAKSRFANFPVEIEMISRFRSFADIRSTLDRLATGEVDVLIGTHRLLSGDVKFKDLGLVVIDEEQRFGVTHKEKLKQLTKQVDCLTLSATPIPRTLNMALSGIRDMSVIEEPPANRQPVQTYVLEHDWAILADAMQKELARGGQVYYLHNRVDTINRTAAHIQQLLGEDVVVAVGHGQMAQKELGDIMNRVSEGEIDVLVCTTIIEAGIDISNVNTLIVEDADHMGLAQLHQIRGRVGRSPRRAYAYMTYRAGKVLAEDAAKRLSAIREFAEFGSGFKIAMRDLEIRGAGNLLGPEQSGFLSSVGYDLYLKLLEEAVMEEKGEKPKRPECSADLNVSAMISANYVPAPEQRMDLYRRIARIRSEADADDVTDELIDRYGDPPREVNNLISIALMRCKATALGIVDITQKAGTIHFTMDDPDPKVLGALLTLYRNRLKPSTGSKPALILSLKSGEDPLRAATAFLNQMQQVASPDITSK